jgi:hypothetical protein
MLESLLLLGLRARLGVQRLQLPLHVPGSTLGGDDTARFTRMMHLPDVGVDRTRRLYERSARLRGRGMSCGCLGGRRGQRRYDRRKFSRSIYHRLQKSTIINRHQSPTSARI